MTFVTDLLLEHCDLDLENETLRSLATELPSFLVHARTDNTINTYFAGFKRWNKWAKHHDVISLPANHITFALFLLSMIQQDCSSSVLEATFYSVKYIHKILAKEDPTDNPLPKEMVEVGKRIIKKKDSRRKTPLTYADLRNIFNHFSSTRSLATYRTLSMLFIAFNGFLRFSELSTIRYSDLQFHDTHLKLYIPSSKTDVYRMGKWVHIASNETELCPIKILKTYLELAEITETSDKDVYLFRALTSSKYKQSLRKKNTPLSYTRVREIILDAVKSIGLDPSKYGTHSLRSGGATCAANAEIPDRIFKQHGRWRTDVAKDMYVQDSLSRLLTVTKNITKTTE